MALQSTTALATITLQAAASEVTFSGIPSTYRDLILVASGSPADTAFPAVLGRVNNNSAAIYNAVRMTGSGSSAGSAISYSNGTYVDLGTAYGAGPATSSSFNLIAQYLDYSATDKHKTILSRTNTPDAGVQAAVTRWGATDVITSLTVITSGGAGFASGSTFSLYGRIA